MRKLAFVLCAVLLGLGVSVAQTKPAQALGSACWFPDTAGVVYTDWYKSTSVQVFDNNPGVWRTVNTDLRAYRLSGGNGIGTDGHCYRGYYTSVWMGDGSGCSCVPHLRVWACGTGPTEWTYPAPWDWRNDAISYPWSNGITMSVRLVDSGATRLLDFGDYGTVDARTGYPCMPQADQASSYAWSPTWVGGGPVSNPAGVFYVNF